MEAGGRQVAAEGRGARGGRFSPFEVERLGVRVFNFGVCSCYCFFERKGMSGMFSNAKVFNQSLRDWRYP